MAFGDVEAPKRVRLPIAKTISLKRGSKFLLKLGAQEFPVDEDYGIERPKTLADCERMGLGTHEKCPFVSCKYNLYLDVNEQGGIKINHPRLEPDELDETCALAVASRDGETLDSVGEILDITRQAVRIIEKKALEKLRKHDLDPALLEPNREPWHQPKFRYSVADDQGEPDGWRKTRSMSREEFRRARRALGLTQEEMARSLGLNKWAIAWMESGRRCVDEGTATKLQELLSKRTAST